ncbi:histidine kinase [Halobacteriales archaeon QS_5_70_17]|jgi:IMP dehydrogenase|nr:MAG: histidine kinase [Halobacteriales archaeon QS_5_70_17]
MSTRDDQIRVEDVMSTPLETISSDAAVEAAAARMRDDDIKALLVPGAEMGIVTSTDILEAVAAGWDVADLRVEEVATIPVETVTTDLQMNEAAAMMTNFGINHLPVVDGDGDYAGMVSSTDVTAALSQE